MLEYLIRRIVLMFPTLFGVVLITFALIQILPGGPVEQAISKRLFDAHAEGGSVPDHTGGKKLVDQELIDHLNKTYGFDKPIHEQFFNWIYRLFTFQFGDSYFHNRSVISLVKERLPVSVSLGVITFLLTYLVCIPLGMAKAVRNGSTFDVVTSVIVLVGYSIPGFVLGIFLILLFGGGTLWDLFPLRGLTSDNFAELSFWGQIKDLIHHLTLPIICLTIGSFAVITNLTKNSVLENIKQQYVVTAKAKGLTQSVILWKHVFRNSMIPLATGFAGNFLTMFFTGSLLIETLFSLDGLGLLSYQAVIQRDYPIVMASLFFFTFLYLISNLLSDILYVIIDPRISFQSSAH